MILVSLILYLNVLIYSKLLKFNFLYLVQLKSKLRKSESFG